MKRKLLQFMTECISHYAYVYSLLICGAGDIKTLFSFFVLHISFCWNCIIRSRNIMTLQHDNTHHRWINTCNRFHFMLAKNSFLSCLGSEEVMKTVKFNNGSFHADNCVFMKLMCVMFCCSVVPLMSECWPRPTIAPPNTGATHSASPPNTGVLPSLSQLYIHSVL